MISDREALVALAPSAEVLLDALIAWDAAGPDSSTDPTARETAMELAMMALPDDALKVAVSSSGDAVDVDVDFSVLLGAALTSMKWLVEEAAQAEDRPCVDVVSDLRVFLAEATAG